MTTLPTRSQATIVSTFAAGVQGRASALANFSVGSTLLAIGEAVGGVCLWLQAMILQLLTATRAATSVGTDLDTWMVDYMPAVPGTVSAALPNGTPRLQAVAATGLVTYSRITVSSTTPLIPVGATVRTADGTQNFAVYADPTNAAYSAALNGYVLAANVASVVVPVQAIVAGAGGNVNAAAISVMSSSIPGGGVDLVTNAAAFTNGVNQESDVALRARFQQYIASLREGTQGAITFAIQSIQTGLQVGYHNNVDPGGAVDYGMVTVYVDDGSGAPPAALITAANAAVGAVIAGGVRYGVYAATTIIANYSMTLTTAAGYTHSTVVGAVGVAVNAFINAVGLENTLHYSQIAAIAYGVPGVTNVTSVLLNSGTADLVPTAGQTIKVGIGTIT